MVMLQARGIAEKLTGGNELDGNVMSNCDTLDDEIPVMSCEEYEIE